MCLDNTEDNSLPQCECAKCGWEWTPRIKDPKWCPKCRTVYWRKEERTKDGKIIHK